MNAKLSLLRAVLLLSFAVSGAACSASTLGTQPGSYMDARLDRCDALDRMTGRTTGSADLHIALARR